MSNPGDWLYDQSANRFRGTYTKGFVDISGGNLIVRNGDVSFNNKLFASSDVSFDSTLHVGDTTTLNSLLLVSGDVSMNNKLFVSNDASLNQNLSVGGNITVDNKLTVAGDASMNSKLQVSNATILDSTISVADNATLSAKLAVAGDASMNGKLQVSNATILDSTISVADNATLSAKLAVAGDASMNGKLQVSNATILDSTISVADDATLSAKLAVAGDASMNSKLQVADATILDSTLFVADDATLAAKLSVTGDASMNSKLQVADATILDSTLSVTGDATLDAKLSVAGDASMNSNLQVANATVLDSTLSVTGETTLNNNLSVIGDAFVSSDLSVNNNVLIGGDLSMQGDLTIIGNLSVFQTRDTETIRTTVNEYQLIVSEDLSLNGMLKMSGDASLNSNLYVKNDTTIDGNLSVGGDVSMNDKLFVNDNVILKSHIIPETDDTYDLGSTTNRFRNMNVKSVVLSSETLHFTGSDSTIAGSLSFDESSNALDLSANGKNGFSVLQYNDKVAIGTSDNTSPNYNLDVSGNMYISKQGIINGDLSVNDALSVTGITKLDSLLRVIGDASMNSKLQVADATILDSTLSVANDTSLAAKLSVSGDASMNSKLQVADATILDSTLSVANDATLSAKLAVAGDASMNSKLQVADATILDSTLSVANDASLAAKLSVAGDASMNSKLQVSDATILDNTLSVANDATLSAKLAVAGDASMNSTLQVADATILDSTLSVANDASLAAKLSVAGDASMNSTLQVADATILDNTLSVANDASMNSKLQVADATILDNTLSVANDASLSAKLSVTGDASMNSKLQVADATILDSTLSVANDASLSAKLSVTGDASMNSKLQVADAAILDNTLSVANDASLSAKLSVTGDASMNSKLQVANAAILDNTLSVANDASLAAKLSVTGDASMNSKLQVANAAILDNTLSVANDASLAAKLAVTGDASMNSKLQVADATTLDSILYVGGDVSMNEKLQVSNATILDSTLSVADVATFDNNVTIKQDLSVNNGVSIGNNLSINGNINLVTPTELNYLTGSTSNIQTQLDSKASIANVDASLNLKSDLTYVDASLNLKSDKTYVDASLNLKSDLTYVDSSLNLKSDKTYVDASLNLKSDLTYVDASLNLKSDKAYVDSSLNLKSDKTYVDASLNLKSDKTSIDASLNLKSDLTYVDASLNLKSDKAYVDASLNLKSDLTYVDSSLNLKAPTANPVFTGSLVASGDISLNDNLVVGGDASFNGDLTVRGNLEVYQQQNTSVINTTVNNYEVIITNDMSLNGNLILDGDASFNGDVYIEGTTNISGDILPIHSNNSNLGSATKPFGSLYISNNTIFFEGSSDANSGSLTFEDGNISILKKGHANNQRRRIKATETTGETRFEGDISGNSHLYLAGDASLNSHLYVSDDVSFDSHFTLGGDASLNNKLFVSDDVSFDSHLSLGGDASFGGRLDVCGNFYAQYPDNSIPNTSISGGILTVSTIQGETAGTEYSNINTLRFDADSGFDVTDLSNGVVKVGMNSTFKTWKVDGQDDLVASGLDSITFVAGNNMDISTNTTSGGEKQIIFHSSGSGGSSSGGSSSSGSSSGSSTLNNKNQTFFDLLTQQPHQFEFDSSSNTTGNITVSWNFDDLIPNITNHTERALLNLYSSGTNRYLPSISEIRFDLSHSSLEAGWNYYSTFTKSVGNDDYNSGSTYKTLSITKQTSPGGSGIPGLLSSTNAFDLRIYGVNNSINYPDEDTRALVIEQLAFKEASPPSDPNYTSNTLQGNDQLYLNYSVDQIEAGETITSAVLDHTQTKYHLNTTLSHYNFDTTIKEDGQENASGTGSFRVELPSLSFGSNFYFLTRISNNLTTLFNISDSDWTSISVNSAPNAYFNTNRDALSVFTNLPGTYGTSTSASHLPSSGELSYNRKSGNSKDYGGFCVINTTAINSDQHIYMNKNFGNTDALGESGSPETFEISDTSKTGNNLGSVSSGIGKYLNGVTDIVTITASVDNAVKQTIKYHGFNATADTGTLSPTQTGNTNFFDNISQYEPYTGATTKGFRLNGRFHVKDIANGTVETVIGPPKSERYDLTLSFSRDSSKTNSGSRSYTTYIYVDDLNGAPTITDETYSSEVKSVKYCMGIPSVNKFNIDLTRTYGNINSQYGYIRGNRQLAYFGGISNVSGDGSGTMTLSGVNSDGIYSVTPTYYTNSSGRLYHTTSRTGTSNFNVSFNEQVYSLYGANNRGNINVSLKHYYDRNSFANDTTTSPKLSISSGDIMEVGSVSNFGSNLFNLTQTSYTNHTYLVEDHTLLYIQGKFQPTSDVTYPTPHSDFIWNNASMSNSGYEAVNKGLDINGNAVTDGNGYKWIVFRFKKINNAQVQFNGTNYNLSGGALGLQSILNSYFNSSVVADIFNESNTNAIGFFTIVMTTDSGTNSYLGALQVLQTPTTSYLSTGTTSRTLDFLVNTNDSVDADNNNGKHGARNGSSGSYTIELALSSMSGSYFYVYIGLK
jgi:UDP-3-O-[3-hydroxymyristoyl] glucosamine N-acyltransferase